MVFVLLEFVPEFLYLRYTPEMGSMRVSITRFVSQADSRNSIQRVSFTWFERKYWLLRSHCVHCSLTLLTRLSILFSLAMIKWDLVIQHRSHGLLCMHDLSCSFCSTFIELGQRISQSKCHITNPPSWLSCSSFHVEWLPLSPRLFHCQCPCLFHERFQTSCVWCSLVQEVIGWKLLIRLTLFSFRNLQTLITLLWYLFLDIHYRILFPLQLLWFSLLLFGRYLTWLVEVWDGKVLVKFILLLCLFVFFFLYFDFHGSYSYVLFECLDHDR